MPKHFSATFEISEATGFSPDTVERHLRRAFPRTERRWWNYLTPEQIAATVEALQQRRGTLQLSLFE